MILRITHFTLLNRDRGKRKHLKAGTRKKSCLSMSLLISGAESFIRILQFSMRILTLIMSGKKEKIGDRQTYVYTYQEIQSRREENESEQDLLW